jgi:hypothetical protein
MVLQIRPDPLLFYMIEAAAWDNDFLKYDICIYMYMGSSFKRSIRTENLVLIICKLPICLPLIPLLS